MPYVGPSINGLAQTLAHAAGLELRHDALGRYWQNRNPRSSYAAQNDDPPLLPEVERRKKALRKSWPELATLIDSIAAGTRRDL